MWFSTVLCVSKDNLHSTSHNLIFRPAALNPRAELSMARAAQTARSARPKLLCVDDSREELELRKQFLQMHGYHVRTAADGERALEILKQHRVDVVLLDFQMPGMGGSETAGHIRRLQPNTRIILFSGYLEPIPATAEALFDAVLWKGEPLRLLLSTLERMTNQSAATDQTRSARKPPVGLGGQRPLKRKKAGRSA